jgi:pyruvate dehydrogenase E1 component beta subunit
MVSSSYLVGESIKATQELSKNDIDVEMIDLRTIKPLDKDLILESVKKTGRLVIVDGAWKSFGISAEISALVSENIPTALKSPIKRICLSDIPAPASSNLEKEYYIDKDRIVREIKNLLK